MLVYKFIYLINYWINLLLDYKVIYFINYWKQSRDASSENYRLLQITSVAFSRMFVFVLDSPWRWLRRVETCSRKYYAIIKPTIWLQVQCVVYCTWRGTVLSNAPLCPKYQYFASSQALPDCPSDEINFVHRDQSGSFVEWHWQGKTELLVGKPVTLSLYPSQVSHEVVRKRIRISAVGHQRRNSRSFSHNGEMCRSCSSCWGTSGIILTGQPNHQVSFAYRVIQWRTRKYPFLYTFFYLVSSYLWKKIQCCVTCMYTLLFWQVSLMLHGRAL